MSATRTRANAALVVAVVLVTGCSIEPDEWVAASQACESNGGLTSLDDVGPWLKADCVNGNTVRLRCIYDLTGERRAPNN